MFRTTGEKYITYSFLYMYLQQYNYILISLTTVVEELFHQPESIPVRVIASMSYGVHCLWNWQLIKLFTFTYDYVTTTCVIFLFRIALTNISFRYFSESIQAYLSNWSVVVQISIFWSFRRKLNAYKVSLHSCALSIGKGKKRNDLQCVYFSND